MDFYTAPAQYVNYQHHQLANGIRIVTETLPYLHSGTLGVWIGSGSRHDPAGLAGQAHFLEHMLYKDGGTPADCNLTRIQDQLGGYANAFTSYENTCFYTGFVKSDLAVGLELLGYLVNKTQFTEADVESERRVVLAEINQDKDAPGELARQLCMQAAWGNHPLVRPILGNAHSVAAITYDDLRHYRRSAFVGANTVLAAAGNINHDFLVAEVADWFNDYPAGAEIDSGLAPQFTPGLLDQEKATNQTYMCLAIEGFPEGVTEFTYINLLAKLLSGGLTARLPQRIREKLGLVYYVRASAMAFRDGGMLIIRTAISPELSAQCLDEIVAELHNCLENGFTTHELAVMRKRLITNIVLGIENSRSRMVRLGRIALRRGQLVGPDIMIETLQGIETAAYNHWLKTTVSPRIALGIVGPAQGLDTLRHHAQRWMA